MHASEEPEQRSSYRNYSVLISLRAKLQVNWKVVVRV
jgi:hypothetical protein